MKYKEICNKHINKLSIELLNNGMPMHETTDLMVAICKVVEKHLGETKCTK